MAPHQQVLPSLEKAKNDVHPALISRADLSKGNPTSWARRTSSQGPGVVEVVYKKQRFLLDPEGGKRMGWDIISMFFLVYSIMMVPLRIAFQVNEYCPSVFWLYESLIDWFFVVDMIVNFNTALRSTIGLSNEAAARATDRTEIAKAYIRSWFLVDFVSSLPLDFFLQLAQGCGAASEPYSFTLATVEYTSKVNNITLEAQRGAEKKVATSLVLFRAFRLIKLLKLGRIVKAYLRIDTLWGAVEDHFPDLISGLRVFKPIGTAFILAHMVTCAWYAIGKWSQEDNGNSWIAAAASNWGVDLPDTTGELDLPWSIAGMFYMGALLDLSR